MAAYEVIITRPAERRFRKLPVAAQKKLMTRILALAKSPRPRGAKKLAGMDNVYRVRAGEYRIIYAVRDRELIILVLKVGHRKDVYR